MKVLLNSFHLNGRTLGFHPQTQKLEPHLLTQGLTLGVKGLRPRQTMQHREQCCTQRRSDLHRVPPLTLLHAALRI